MSKKSRVARGELEDLVNGWEPADESWQPRPESVSIEDGAIRVSYRAWLRVTPLAHGDLFTSFARLAARGEPSERSIRGWVGRFGLPAWGARWDPDPVSVVERKEIGAGEDAHVRLTFERPKPDGLVMPLEEFRDEARYASDLFGVYREIRAENVAEIRAKVAEPRSRLGRELKEEFELVRDRYMLGSAGGPTAVRDGLDLIVATAALGRITSRLVSDVRPRVGIQQVRSLAPSWECRDLPSAMYLQFYLLTTKNRQTRSCENPACGAVFFPTRGNQRHCDPSCRSNARHYRNRAGIT